MVYKESEPADHELRNMETRYSSSTASSKHVRQLQFGILNPKFIVSVCLVRLLTSNDECDLDWCVQRAYSVLEVKTHQTFEKSKPKQDGLSDLRMGTTDRAFACLTCGCNAQDCPGHFGHVELVRPQYHIGFLWSVAKLLKCVSFYTSTLMLDLEDSRFLATQRIRNGEARFKAVLALCDKDKMRCPVTNRIQPKFRVESGTIMVDHGTGRDEEPYASAEGKRPLPASKALQVRSLCQSLGVPWGSLGLTFRLTRNCWDPWGAWGLTFRLGTQ